MRSEIAFVAQWSSIRLFKGPESTVCQPRAERTAGVSGEKERLNVLANFGNSSHVHKSPNAFLGLFATHWPICVHWYKDNRDDVSTCDVLQQDKYREDSRSTNLILGDYLLY